MDTEIDFMLNNDQNLCDIERKRNTFSVTDCT